MMKLTSKRKKIDSRIIYALIMIIGVVLIVLISLFKSTLERPTILNSYQNALQPSPETAQALTYIDDDFTVDPGFSSHLPLVIIDTNGVEPPISTQENIEEERFVKIEGVEPYVDGNISIIEGNTINYLTDSPAQSSFIKIKRRGNSSMLYEKAQYLVKLINEDGEERALSIFNMGADDEWVLNGSMADKSMLRNYLAYSLSSQIMPYTPDNAYCEVLIKTGDRYQYQGLYLMGESIKFGKNRVDIQKYDPDDSFNGYIVRRDRFDEDETILNTIGSEKNYYSSFISLKYPGQKKATSEMVDYVTADINRIEEVLYSDDFSVFSTYPDYLNVDSFVDYFLINEYLGSYDAGDYSTYMYKDVGGKLNIGPVWDFDGTMDNYRNEPLDVEVTAFQYKPWFDRLMTDKAFMEKIENRYQVLQQTVFAEENVMGKIDEIENYLGDARTREWNRWSDIYTTDNKYSLKPYLDDDGETLYRNATTYDEEIYRIKTALRQHGQALSFRIEILELSTTWDTSWSNRMNIWLLVIGLFFGIAAIYAQNR